MMAAQVYPHGVPTAPLDKVRAQMDVIFHIGARFPLAQKFGSFVQSQKETLHQTGVRVWGDAEIRSGVLDGVTLPSGRRGVRDRRRRGVGRSQIYLKRYAHEGVYGLFVSAPDALGPVAQCIDMAQVYPGAGERMARLAHAFQGGAQTVLITICALEDFWNFHMSNTPIRDMDGGRADPLDRFVTHPRSWQAIIEDVACAMPNAQIFVTTDDHLSNHPGGVLGVVLGDRQAGGRTRANHAPFGLADFPVDNVTSFHDDRHVQRFAPSQRAALQEKYAKDLNWLRAGADGLALFIEETGPDWMGLPHESGDKL